MNHSPEKKQRLLPTLIFLGFLACPLTISSVALADDPPAESEESYYANPAQAAHASQLADQAFANDEEAQQELEKDFAELDAQFEAGEISEEELEIAKDELVAEKLGVFAAEVQEMRESGMGWGEIAHELGVHPSHLGLGHVKGKAKRSGTELEFAGNTLTAAEIEEATQRTTGKGKAKGHGSGVTSNSQDSGFSMAANSGPGKGKKDQGPSASSSGGSSSSGKTDKGNNAGGQGKDKGNSGKGGNDKDKGNDKGKGKG